MHPLTRIRLTKHLLILLACILCGTTLKAQQNAQYSQYTFNGLFINPAYAGYKQDFYIHSFYRSQWTGLNGAPQNLSLSVDGAVNDKKVGLGLQMLTDVVGAQSLFSATASYAYRLQIGSNENSRLCLGIGLGFIQAGLDGTKLNPIDGFDPSIPQGRVSNILPTGRAGILYTNDDVFIGIASDNLITKVFNKDYTLKVPLPQPHYYFNAGAILKTNADVKIKPSVLFKTDLHGPASLDLNTSILLNEQIWLGAAYRTAAPFYNKLNPDAPLQKSNAILGLVEFMPNQNIRIGYAFDFSLSKLSNYSYGSHEISLGIFLRRSKTTPNTAKCYF